MHLLIEQLTGIPMFACMRTCYTYIIDLFSHS